MVLKMLPVTVSGISKVLNCVCELNFEITQKLTKK